MKKMRLLPGLFGLALGLLPQTAHGQAFDAAGSRAAGMGGAFVGVADDATAIYWNPAGLAAGPIFSLVLDGGARSVTPDGSANGAKQSTLFAGLTTPALGFAYYRLHNATAVPDPLLVPIDTPLSSRNQAGAPFVRVESLVTHTAGITFVQSILPGVAVGSTLKVVHGSASSVIRPTADASVTLDDTDDETLGDTDVDLDIGVMAVVSRLKFGFALRNVKEPSFTTPEGRTLRLDRQARAGLSYVMHPSVMFAADLDLLEYDDAFGARRDAALGVEARLFPRTSLRAGFRWNTADDHLDGDRRALTFGGSYAVKAAIFVDALAVVGDDWGGSRWGVAARFVY